MEPGVFNPPPKVRSAVIRLTRNKTSELGCDERLFRRVVKTTFNQRRKTLRNNIRPLLGQLEAECQAKPGSTVDADGLRKPDFTPLLSDPIMAKRPEQLSVQDFIEFTHRLQEYLPQQ